jgi:formate/nitrite transporter FocA (FNT family)
LAISALSSMLQVRFVQELFSILIVCRFSFVLNAYIESCCSSLMFAIPEVSCRQRRLVYFGCSLGHNFRVTFIGEVVGGGLVVSLCSYFLLFYLLLCIFGGRGRALFLYIKSDPKYLGHFCVIG